MHPALHLATDRRRSTRCPLSRIRLAAQRLLHRPDIARMRSVHGRGTRAHFIAKLTMGRIGSAGAAGAA